MSFSFVIGALVVSRRAQLVRFSTSLLFVSRYSPFLLLNNSGRPALLPFLDARSSPKYFLKLV